jgi:hypothetical protein
MKSHDHIHPGTAGGLPPAVQAFRKIPTGMRMAAICGLLALALGLPGYGDHGAVGSKSGHGIARSAQIDTGIPADPGLSDQKAWTAA